MAPHCMQVCITVSFCAADGARGGASGRVHSIAAASDARGNVRQVVANRITQARTRSYSPSAPLEAPRGRQNRKRRDWVTIRGVENSKPFHARARVCERRGALGAAGQEEGFSDRT